MEIPAPELIRPALQDEAFLTDARAAAADPEAHETFHLWWLGQSGYLLHWRGHFILLDPYLSDSLTRKYADTDKPHIRMTARVVAPERLGFASVVTASHAHTDHLDPETLRPLVAANPRIFLVGAESTRGQMRERSGLPDEQIIGLDAEPTNGLPVSKSPRQESVGPFRFDAIPAAHEKLDRDADDRHLYLGFVIQFGRWKLYHAGDTVHYPGMGERLRGFAPDVALLPINGRGEGRRVAGNLWGDEAAELAREMGARIAIPCHYDQFQFNTATPEVFVQTCQRLGQGYAILRAGERWTANF